MMKTERAGAWPSQTRRSRDNPEPPSPQSRSFSRYQSIPSASNGERSAGPPGKVARDAAEEIEAPALPLIASATSLPAMWVALRPWPE